MELVIDISDSDYKKIQQFAKGNTCYSVTERLYQAIKNGIPLPKGHGRLIDADKLLDENIDTFMLQTETKIRIAPTIIGADKGENNL